METKNLLNLESSRMEAFRLLSDCYRLPDQAFIEKIKRLEIHLANFSESASLIVRQMRSEFDSNTLIEQLKIDHSKLFVGPYTLLAPPYGSVYLDGERKIMGDSTFDVINRYREAGLQTAENYKDAPDHISAELEFMYYLIFKEIEAFSKSGTEEAVAFLQKQKDFLEDHLLAWVPEFAGYIKKHAENPFYNNLGGATVAFLEDSYRRVCTFLEAVQTDLEGTAPTAPGSFEAIAGLVGKYQASNMG